MHSGILRSAVHTPFHEAGCGGCQRSVLIGGFAKGTPNQALHAGIQHFARHQTALGLESVRWGSR